MRKRIAALEADELAMLLAARYVVSAVVGQPPYTMQDWATKPLADWPYERVGLFARGSSGAPVQDDNWQAVALHRGFKKVNADLYKGEAGKSEIVKFYNEGVVIHDILARLPQPVLQEIKDAQGWE
jgi:hypothetical protein